MLRGTTTRRKNEDVQKIMGHRTEGLSEALGMAAPYDTVIHRDNLLVMR